MFIIVAEREGVQIYNRHESPSGALEIAENRIKSGAEKVSVCNRDGAFISASALKRMAQGQADVRSAQPEIGPADPAAAISHTDRSTTKGKTIRVGGLAAEAKGVEPLAAPLKQRVRVFKAHRTK